MTSRRPSPDVVSVDRRRVLAAVAAVGSTGALTGFGTQALLADTERQEATLASGLLDLAVSWQTGEENGSSDGRVTLDLSLTPEDDSGSAVLAAELPTETAGNNPGFVWLRSFCPEPVSLLGSALWVELWYADAAGNRIGPSPIISGSLNDVTEALRGGTLLDDPSTGSDVCLHPDDGPLSLRFEWDLADDYDGSGGPTTATFEFGAVQCRHGDVTANPFPPAPSESCAEPTVPRYAISHITVWICDPTLPDCTCIELGKLEEIEFFPGTYDLPDRDGGDTGYDVVITAAAVRDEDGNLTIITDAADAPAGAETVGVAFTLVHSERDDPTLCQVLIKGARGQEVYGTESLTGNETDGILYAPAKTGGGS